MQATSSLVETVGEVYRKAGFKGFFVAWRVRYMLYLLQALFTVDIIERFENKLRGKNKEWTILIIIKYYQLIILFIILDGVASWEIVTSASVVVLLEVIYIAFVKRPIKSLRFSSFLNTVSNNDFYTLAPLGFYSSLMLSFHINDV